jgi:hypothetical protein
VTVATKGKKMGAASTKFFQIRADDDFFADLDALRKLQDDLPTRTDMIKRLVKYAVRKKLVVHEDVNAVR